MKKTALFLSFLVFSYMGFGQNTNDVSPQTEEALEETKATKRLVGKVSLRRFLNEISQLLLAQIIFQSRR